ncbi:RNA polymerase factor sigma-54 [bacterium]|nr:RNA polymerase factor sigma-54 [bacterium]
MSQGFRQILSQQMKLTPQQVLLSSLLQLPIQALEQRIKQELEQNPLLEEVQDLDETLEQTEELEEEQELKLEQEDPKKEEEKAEAEIKAADEKEKKEEQEVDWEQFLNDDNHFEIRLPRDMSSEEDETEWIQPQRTTLADHLLDQLRFTNLDEKQKKIGEYIIWNINEDGYLVYEDTVNTGPEKKEIETFSETAQEFQNDAIDLTAPVEEETQPKNNVKNKIVKIDPVQAIADELKVSVEEVEEVLKVVQTFDPAGIAARNLKECILIQLNQRLGGFYDNGTSLSIRIVHEAYHDFINRRYDKVAKQMKITLDEIKRSIAEILQLNPKPGEGYIQAEQNYVTPDVAVKKVNEKFEIIVNDYGMPRLRINNAYRKMMLDKDKTQKDTKEFIKNKLEAAKWLINSLYRRRDTIYRTVETIVELQKDFFEKGKEFIKPMKLEDVATKIGMDISTISRATNGKYVQTDYGVFELKYFFSTAMTSAEGEDVSTKQLKAALKKIIDEEDKSKPLSDEDLAKTMTAQGNPIARRTITKYREQLMIAPARLRRQI